MPQKHSNRHGATQVNVITSWWRGYVCDISEVDRSKYKCYTCDECGRRVESTWFPIEWGEIEFICEECDRIIWDSS